MGSNDGQILLMGDAGESLFGQIDERADDGYILLGIVNSGAKGAETAALGQI